MGRLTAAQRKRMPKSEFALPSKRKGGKGGYPIPDKAHARDALSRVSANGTAAEKATVRAKVKRKFPGIAVGGGKSKPKKGMAKLPSGRRFNITKPYQ